VMIVLNLAAFGIGMNNRRPIPSEGQHTGGSALGTSPLGD
jgi:hypothetical protein